MAEPVPESEEMNVQIAGRTAPLRRILALLALILITVVLTQRLVGLLARPAPADDFVQYWAAAKLNAGGQNPYLAENLQPLAVAEGRPPGPPALMWYPPWVLALVAPFGLLPYSPAHWLWVLLQLGMVFFSATLIWQLYSGPKKLLWLAWTVALVFGPTLMMLAVGQISAMVLLGLVGFLWFERRNQLGLAGVFLFLAATKPQLLHLVWFAALLWALQGKRWRFLAGFTVAAAASVAMAVAINPAVLADYLTGPASNPPLAWATPTLGTALLYAFGYARPHIWPQVLPGILSLVWCAFYWGRHRRDWRWLNEMPLLLAISVATTAYLWPFDLVVLVILLLQVLAFSLQTGRLSLRTYLPFLPLLVVDLLALVQALFGPKELFFFVWLPICFLLAYLIARREMRKSIASGLRQMQDNQTPAV
jgi:hypothetical protein